MAPGNWLLVQRLVTTTLYNLLRLVFIPIQRICWQLNGTARMLREARLPQNYERSAQVLDVVLFHKFCHLQRVTVSDFLCTHNRFENPQYIIDHDNITLMTLTDKDAVFCEANRDMHLWRVKYSPFMLLAQGVFARRLIVVPLTTLHRMSEEIGDPKGELIFLFNTARCGSTLLTQIMEYTGRCVAISEPNSPNIVAARYRKFGDSPEIRQLARDVMRWDCRPLQTMQPQPLAYFVKITAVSTVALPMLRELFPSSRCLFMYRDFVASAKSMYRMSATLPSLRLAYMLGSFSGQLTKAVVDSMGFDGADYAVKLESEVILGVLVAIVTTVSYLDLRRQGVDISALRYEDLCARPLETCRAILDKCGLPQSLAENAVRGFDADSQENSPVAKSLIGHVKVPELTSQAKEQLNERLKRNGMPLIGEPCIIEGTFTC